MISLTGLYLVYDVLSRDETPINENAPIAKNITSNKNENSSNIIATKLQNKENTTSKGNSAIVDQTLFSPISKAEKPPAVNEVLGALNEKIEIEITLIESVQNKVLENYDVEFKYLLGTGTLMSGKSKTDKNGKFTFTSPKIRFLVLHIFTKDYAVHFKDIPLNLGKNEYKARLFKGGSIEIRATNADNKTISGLLAYRIFSGDQYSELYPLTFDVARGIYILSNMPVGIHGITFSADGYRKTNRFIIRVEPHEVSYIEIKLLLPKIILLDLDIKDKPDSILISDNLYSTKSGKENKAIASKRFQAFKNGNGLYEYELENINIKNIAIYLENYEPKEVLLLPSINSYKLTLTKGFSVQVLVNNENGKPIKGASVVYYEDKFKQIAETNESGLALLTGLNKKMILKLNISHNDFMELDGVWPIDENISSEKIFILNETKSISGKINYNGKIVMGAKVSLVANFKNEFSDYDELSIESNENGNYSFNNSEDKKNKEFFIKAFHPEYGVAISPVIKFENKNQNYDLILVKEKSILIKLVDGKGNPLSNKNITIYDNRGFYNERRTFNDPYLSFFTDENGKHELFNLVHGSYRAFLKDPNLKVKNETFQVPTDSVVLIAEQQDLLKVVVTTPKGGTFNGNLKCMSFNLPIEIPISEDGNYYLQPNFYKTADLSKPFLFEAEGYGAIAMGPYLKVENLPKEIIINLIKAENCRIKVLDDKSNSPIPFVTVDISSDNILQTVIRSMPTSELGEILFTNLSGKFNVVIKADGYAPYKKDFIAEETKEVIVRLVKGGGLKGHITLDENIAYAYTLLKPYFQDWISIGADGNFEFVNIPPGEYTLIFNQRLKNGALKSNVDIKKIKRKVIIENDIITEINLDEALKK